MPRRSRLLSPLLALAWATSGAWAGKKMFNIHDDLLAFPQFEVRFPNDYISESQAQELLRAQHSTFDGAHQNNQNNQAQVHLSGKRTKRDDDDTEKPEPLYEELSLEGQRYFCQIPRVDLGSQNQTDSNEPDEAEEKKELARATDRGLELLREMEGKCMYYVSGWWSYSLCYKRQIKQFHALPSGSGIPSYPPMEDPTTHSFILGKFPRRNDDGDIDEEPMHKTTTTDVAELQTRGGSRYLVQRLEGGTTCDLTGKKRKIEIQFHCHPQSTDRIGWIKELTTCSYLMVVYTPRLCNDVAFLPPQQDEVHTIECREILSPDEVGDWEAMREYQMSQRLVESAAPIPIVGDIEVGAKRFVGKDGKQIEKGRVASIGEELVEVVAKRENGELKWMSKSDLKKYDLNPEEVDTLRKRVEDVAQGRDWTLEVVEANGEHGLRGIVNTYEDDQKQSKGKNQQQQQQQQQQEQQQQGKQQSGAGAGAGSGSGSGSSGHDDDEGEGSRGSEEVFIRDEL